MTKRKRSSRSRSVAAFTRSVTTAVVSFWNTHITPRVWGVSRILKQWVKHRRYRYVSLQIINKFSTGLIVIGLVVIFFPLIYDNMFESQNTPPQDNEKRQEPSASAQASSFGPIKIDASLTSGRVLAQPPSRIVIPAVRIDLPVTESRVINGYWEVSETTASHGMGSGYPGQLGNTVIFAHARAGLFLPLRDSNINDTIYILTNDRWHRYRVKNKKEVSPKEIQIIQPTTDETLTLFTCSGFLDNKRLVVIAKPDR